MGTRGAAEIALPATAVVKSRQFIVQLLSTHFQRFLNVRWFLAAVTYRRDTQTNAKFGLVR
jgi:hypothetical protein